MSQRVGPTFQQKDYAGFWRRSAALAIDFFLLGAIYTFVSDFWPDFVPESWLTVEAAVSVEFGLFLFALAYCFLFRLTCNGTLGYRIVGIRYASMIDENPKSISLLYRAGITLFMAWGLFLIDHFWILFDPCKQTWHDKVSGFYVVRRKAASIGTRTVSRRIINFMMLSFVVWEPGPPDVRMASTS